MSIIRNLTMSNGATATYHRVQRIEITAAGLVVTVGTWPSPEQQQLIGDHAIWQTQYTPADGELATLSVAGAEAWCAGPTGPLAGGTVVDDTQQPLEVRRARQWASIKAERERREGSGIVWDGSAFQTDAVSRARIAAAVQEAQLASAATQPFERAWVLADNTVRVMSAEDMLALGAALGACTDQLCATAQALRVQIDATDEPERVTWPA